ncbi:MAG: bifunctional 3-deoxy-7-phosphoheptulonate synthase/chorismate mutase type II [Bacteroidota bacterium]
MDLNIISLDQWFPLLKAPLIISGPCSAESEDQVMNTARDLAKVPQVKVFRAGIWKPRTRPDGFQGVGKQGLAWLQRVKAETGLLITTEVASPLHIEQALEAGIDILWIGARTVVNPFSMQEIADSLKGVDIPVMVKNPIHPDIKLWIGALERLNNAGITRLIAVHRGFHYFERQPYRNSPMWEIPIELKRIYPNLPLICDPSHISGKRSGIAAISQKALDLEMDGLMIESHYAPDTALTDARQQLLPADLEKILQNLIVRSPGDIQFQSRLEQLRTEVDKIDWELLDILGKRMKIVEEIGDYKKENDITVLQIKRWRDIIVDRMDVGIKLGLDRDFLLKVLELIHQESIRRQMDILNWPRKEES